MNELANTSRGRRIEHDARVCDCCVEGLPAVRKPDPVRVEERAGAFKTSLQVVGAIEIEGHCFDLIAKGNGPRRMSCQRPDASPTRQQNARDVPAGVSRRTRDNVEVILRHRAVSSNLYTKVQGLSLPKEV
jgi:hypothetical protein